MCEQSSRRQDVGRRAKKQTHATNLPQLQPQLAVPFEETWVHAFVAAAVVLQSRRPFTNRTKQNTGTFPGRRVRKQAALASARKGDGELRQCWARDSHSAPLAAFFASACRPHLFAPVQFHLFRPALAQVVTALPFLRPAAGRRTCRRGRRAGGPQPGAEVRLYNGTPIT